MLIWSDLKYNRGRFFQECKNILLEKTYKFRKNFQRSIPSIKRTFSISGKSTNYIRGAYRRECNPMIDKEMAKMSGVEY